jgi:hypothetical protein
LIDLGGNGFRDTKWHQRTELITTTSLHYESNDTSSIDTHSNWRFWIGAGNLGQYFLAKGFNLECVSVRVFSLFFYARTPQSATPSYFSPYWKRGNKREASQPVNEWESEIRNDGKRRSVFFLFYYMTNSSMLFVFSKHAKRRNEKDKNRTAFYFCSCEAFGF